MYLNRLAQNGRSEWQKFGKSIDNLNYDDTFETKIESIYRSWRCIQSKTLRYHWNDRDLSLHDYISEKRCSTEMQLLSVIEIELLRLEISWCKVTKKIAMSAYKILAVYVRPSQKSVWDLCLYQDTRSLMKNTPTHDPFVCENKKVRRECEKMEAIIRRHFSYASLTRIHRRKDLSHPAVTYNSKSDHR